MIRYGCKNTVKCFLIVTLNVPIILMLRTADDLFLLAKQQRDKYLQQQGANFQTFP